MNKNRIIKIILIFLFPTFLYANDYCQKCGMDLHHHQKTSHIATNGDEEIGVCSLHCVIDVKKDGKKYKIKGFDNSTKSFIPINKLIYVVGSNQKGAMSSESEFAFSKKDDADRFQKENGGRLIDGREIIGYAESKWDKDKRMIENNQAKIKEMGQKIAKEYCNNADKIKANNIADFKMELKKYCQNIDGKGLQAAALHLWSQNDK